MLAFKVAFFVLAAASFIEAAPESSVKINCYISYLKEKNLFTEHYTPSGSLIDAQNCDEIIQEFNYIIEKTYNDMLGRNDETKNDYDCIMDALLKTNIRDYVLMNLVLENKRLNGELDEESYCKLSTETKEITKKLIVESVEKCIPNTKFAKTFNFHTNCVDPKTDVKVAL